MSAELSVLKIQPWQTVVMHASLHLSRAGASQTPPCVTRLPAIVCACGLYLIEVGDDGLGPRAVGAEGKWD